MKYTKQVIQILNDTLQLEPGRLQADSVLLGNLAELDSMAIVSVITSLENAFAITVDDEDISAIHFESVQSLAHLIEEKMHVA